MQLSKNFDSKEFECPCCGKSNMNTYFVYTLQGLRDKVGKPIIISKGGGFRCYSYNYKTGGSAYSSHKKGLAVDCYCKGLTLKMFHKHILKNFWITYNGLGIDKDRHFIHLDLGKRFTRWIYINGKPHYFF